MSIKSDAFAILKLVFKKRNTSASEISAYFEFDKERTLQALTYLEERNFIKVAAKAIGGEWVHITPTASAIYLYEQEEQIEVKKTEEKKESAKEALSQLSRIERNVNALRSRQYRETTFYASLYPLIIASFVAIGFPSFIEFLNTIWPEENKSSLTLLFYFLVMISIGACVFAYKKMRKTLDIDNYVVKFKIKRGVNKFELLTKIRKIFEQKDHQLYVRTVKFEGIFINEIRFFLATYNTKIKRVEELMAEDYSKKIEEVCYDFEYVNRRNSLSRLVFDLKNDKMKIDLDKSVDSKIANEILSELSAENELELIDKSGWDY